MLVAQALVYFVVIGTLTVGAAIAAHLALL